MFCKNFKFIHILWFEFLPVPLSACAAWSKPSALRLVGKRSATAWHPHVLCESGVLWCIRSVWRLRDSTVELVLPSITWVLEMELRLPGLQGKCIYLSSHLPDHQFCCFLFRLIFLFMCMLYLHQGIKFPGAGTTGD